MYFRQFYDSKLAQYAYLIGCQASGEAVIFDPMRDIDQYLEDAAANRLKITAAADTHIHADYISGLREFAERGVRVFASDEGDDDWKYEWLIHSPEGKYDYRLLKNGDFFQIGNVRIEAWHTPGHTSEHLTFKVTDRAAADEPMGLITGDFIFVGDVGRPDLLESAAGMTDVMEPAARRLYQSVKEFEKIPDYLQIWPGHGAGSACGKSLGAVPESTAGYEKRYNSSIKAATSEIEFVNYILEGQPEPPFYFDRMKRENKTGPAVTGGLPVPRHMTVKELAAFGLKNNAVVLDTRPDNEYLSGHLPGSLLAPLDRQFTTIAGSYVTENKSICLIVEASRLREAVTDLYRVGLDKIAGYATIYEFEQYSDQGGKLDSLEVLDFEEAANRSVNESQILDVRKRSEFDSEGHIAGAKNMVHTRLLARLGELPKDRNLVVHCSTGTRAALAGALLKQQGFDVSVVIDNFSEFHKKKPDLIRLNRKTETF